ncbi:MAG TPA: hypothetical protein ENG66_07435 [Thermococcus sp.]|nr:hypothetical protein [Thermococcus sp.]
MKVYVVVKVNYDDETLEWVEVCKNFREVKKVFEEEGIRGISRDDVAIQPNEDEGIVYYIEEVGIR